MNELSGLVPIIAAHAEELKVPGVASIRPGYQMENGWPTRKPAIVVVASGPTTTPKVGATLDWLLPSPR